MVSSLLYSVFNFFCVLMYSGDLFCQYTNFTYPFILFLHSCYVICMLLLLALEPTPSFLFIPSFKAFKYAPTYG